ncbi:MAG: hypothetical protein ACLR47_14115 [Ruminococcus bicirculans (ex Wegman et al. 2014)]|uniref:hypothetical protein n=1 Tax=Ruminococcus bicirculans (ex Wegman et al. 2014) TaxID=1160721 RepID=UPI0039A249B9
MSVPIQGGVDIKDCYTIEEIAEICEQDKLSQMLIPLDRAFVSYEKNYPWTVGNKAL